MRASASKTFVSSGLLLFIFGIGALAQSSPASAAHIRTVQVHNATELSDAMTAANRSGRPTIIKLAPGDYALEGGVDSGPGFGISSLPPVRTPIALVGKNADTTVIHAALNPFRAITVMAHGALLVEGITLAGNHARCDGIVCATDGGGAVANFGGRVWLNHCVLSDNSAFNFQGNGGVYGGALLNKAGHMWIDHTTVTGSRVNGIGAALAVIDGTVELWDSSVRASSISTGLGSGLTIGGGIYVGDSGRLFVDFSTISGNDAAPPGDPDFGGLGGGLFNAGAAWINNSAITENRTETYGNGGGVFNSGRMVIENTSIAGNLAATQGGGIFNSGKLTLRSVTLARNDVAGSTSVIHHFPAGCDTGDDLVNCISRGGGLWNAPNGTVRMIGTAIASNGATDCEGTLVSDGFNAIGITSNCTLQPASSGVHDLLNIDAQLGEVEDNGEAGEARVPLLAGSPLIDAGGKVEKHCSRRDQLGNRRTDGNNDGIIRCDIGAVEFLRSLR